MIEVSTPYVGFESMPHARLLHETTLEDELLFDLREAVQVALEDLGEDNVSMANHTEDTRCRARGGLSAATVLAAVNGTASAGDSATLNDSLFPASAFPGARRFRFKMPRPAQPTWDLPNEVPLHPLAAAPPRSPPTPLMSQHASTLPLNAQLSVGAPPASSAAAPPTHLVTPVPASSSKAPLHHHLHVKSPPTPSPVPSSLPPSRRQQRSFSEAQILAAKLRMTAPKSAPSLTPFLTLTEADEMPPSSLPRVAAADLRTHTADLNPSPAAAEPGVVPPSAATREVTCVAAPTPLRPDMPCVGAVPQLVTPACPTAVGLPPVAAPWPAVPIAEPLSPAAPMPQSITAMAPSMAPSLVVDGSLLSAVMASPIHVQGVTPIPVVLATAEASTLPPQSVRLPGLPSSANLLQGSPETRSATSSPPPIESQLSKGETSDRPERAERPRLGWSALEDKMIRTAVATMGFKWRKIAQLLPNRSDDSVRNRWHRLEECLRQQKLREQGDVAVDHDKEKEQAAPGYKCSKCSQPKKHHICLAPDEANARKLKRPRLQSRGAREGGELEAISPVQNPPLPMSTWPAVMPISFIPTA